MFDIKNVALGPLNLPLNQNHVNSDNLILFFVFNLADWRLRTDFQKCWAMYQENR